MLPWFNLWVSATRLSYIIEQMDLFGLGRVLPFTPRINVDLIRRLPIKGTLLIYLD